METSKEELLDGMEVLNPKDPFPDDLFYAIFEIEDPIERTQYIEAARNQARSLKRMNEFNRILKSFFLDYSQKMKEHGNKTKFTEQPVELECGEWRATDLGIITQHFDSAGKPVTVLACSHPIMPVEILKDIDTGNERVTLAYFKYGYWQRVTVSREVCADNSTIVKVLSKIGVEVTSENAKSMVRYLSDCIGLNPAKLQPKRSINRMGWAGSEFMPYAEGIVYDGDRDFESVYKNIGQGGSFEVWKAHCSELRKNLIVRMAFAASLGSVLIEPLNILPFVFHIWSGESGTCKTVAIMAAMSIWGNPKMGGLVKTMNTTKVGILRSAAFLYSLPFAGDELQTMKDKWTTNFDQLIYQITEGIDRVRGRASGGVEETKTWHNSFLFTGEEPITKANSRGGAKNRVIEAEAEGKLLPDGNYTVSLITENYGHAGRMLIEEIQKVDLKELRAEYKRYFDEICNLNTTEKQAMAMSCMLLADRIMTDFIFTDEKALTIDEVKSYLRSAKEVDVAERSYQMVLNWISRNPLRFEDPREEGSANRGEVWGKIDENKDDPDDLQVAVINKDVLCAFLELSGFDYSAVSKKWAEKDRILRTPQGKYVHNARIYGTKTSCIKIIIGGKQKNNDFVPIDGAEGQITLPFD